LLRYARNDGGYCGDQFFDLSTNLPFLIIENAPARSRNQNGDQA